MRFVQSNEKRTESSPCCVDSSILSKQPDTSGTDLTYKRETKMSTTR